VNLIIVIHSLAGGGAERVVSTLANYWSGEGWDITIVTMAPKTDDVYLLHPGVKRIALKLNGESGNSFIGLAKNVQRVFALRKILYQTKPDVALGMMTGANVVLALAAWGVCKSVGSERIHPPQFPLSLIWEKLRSITYRMLSAVVAQTNESAQWLLDNTSAKNVVVIPNMSSGILSIQEPILMPEKYCTQGRKLLLAVGRLDRQKGFDELINAFSTIAAAHRGWDLVILGEGELRPSLESLISKVGLVDRIKLPGRAGNVGRWYEYADIYVMSSRFEGFPNTLIEAMSYGLPVVSYDCDTGPRDIITNEVDGLLVQQGNVFALQSTLARLMNDTELRALFASNALRVNERFSVNRVVMLWENLFEDVCTSV
jgi:glycosyltransferase involved in cell wall biosynthesis